MDADPEQELLLDLIFAIRPDGRSAAFEVDIVGPRQNFKTGTILMAELGWLFVTEQKLIVHSAHELDTTAEAFRDLAAMIERTPSMARRLAPNRGERPGISEGNGRWAIELRTGQRMKYKARTKARRPRPDRRPDRARRGLRSRGLPHGLSAADAGRDLGPPSRVRILGWPTQVQRAARQARPWTQGRVGPPGLRRVGRREPGRGVPGPRLHAPQEGDRLRFSTTRSDGRRSCRRSVTACSRTRSARCVSPSRPRGSRGSSSYGGTSLRPSRSSDSTRTCGPTRKG